MMKRTLSCVVLAVVGAACSSTPEDDPCAGRKAGDLVITEVMADPEGADTGKEWFEVFNTLGTALDLKGLTISYKDTDGSGLKKHVVRSGTVQPRAYLAMGDIRSGPNPEWIGYSYGTGLGALGNARGVITVSCGDLVIDEFTYTTAAVTNRSRQLDGRITPDSTANDDESTWCQTPAGNTYFGTSLGTPGQPNPACGTDVVTGSCVETDPGAPQAGNLIITEMMADPEGVDTGKEWFEIYNATDDPIDLTGVVIAVRDGDTSTPRTHTIREGSAPARGYYTFGDVRSGPNPEWIDYSYGDSLGALNNSRGSIALRCGNATIDEYSYSTAVKTNRSRQLDGAEEPDVIDRTDTASWCDTPEGNVYFGVATGTPGEPNPECLPEASTGTCLDNGVVRPVVSPQPGQVIITEVMARPASTSATTGEWFEVLAFADVDLNGLTLATNTSSTKLNSPNCLRVGTNQYGLMARSSDAFVNGGLPTPLGTYSLSFPDSSNQRITLYRGDAGIDMVSLFPSASGRAWQLDPNKLDSASNDLPESFCYAPQRWSTDGGGDYGSPGAVNPGCEGTTPTNPDECIDPVSLQTRAVQRPQPGEVVITEWMADPAKVADTAGEYVEVLFKADADLNGLTLSHDTAVTTLTSANCLPVTANTFAVFGRVDDPAQNGGLPALSGVFTFGLTNSGAHTLAVTGFDGGVLDQVSYSGTATAGASQQLSAGHLDPADNDDPANLCTTPTGQTYGAGDRGTPGQVNVTCP